MSTLATTLNVEIVRSNAGGKSANVVPLGIAATVVGSLATAFRRRTGKRPVIAHTDSAVAFQFDPGDVVMVFGADAELLREAYRDVSK